jgi:signal transduction histidine kinase
MIKKAMINIHRRIRIIDGRIENAISAMGSSGVLTVRTSLADSGKRIAVSVSDTGKGIPERYMDKLFQPYFTMKPGGTGLGLCITKRIIEDHKGTIAVQSKEGEGTTVTVTLPVAP